MKNYSFINNTTKGLISVVESLNYIPKEAICNKCCSSCKRHSIASRKIKDISLDNPKTIKIKVGVYRCKKCSIFFRKLPDNVEKGKHYSKRAVQKVYDAVSIDKTTFCGVEKRVSRDFNIKPSKSTCHKWFHDRAGEIDLTKSYEPFVVNNFSGAMAIDEVFDGGKCTFFATDPINNIIISFHRSNTREGEQLKQFLKRLKSFGIIPEVLISDAALIYENIPGKVFGDNLKHQICIFHFIRDCFKFLYKALKQFLSSLSKQPKIKLKKENYIEYKLRLSEFKDRKLIWDNRYVFISRKSSLKPLQRMNLKYLSNKYQFLTYLSELKDDLLDLYSVKCNRDKVISKKSQIINKYKDIFNQEQNILKIFKKLNSKNFEKTLTFMEYKNLDATSNHVERTNRWFRKRQKTHYRNRKEENIVNMIKADMIKHLKERTDKPPERLIPIEDKNLKQAI